MLNRMYPDWYPNIKNEPTYDKFCISNIDQMGEGLKTLVEWKKYDIIFQFIGIILPFQNLYTLELNENQFIYDPFVMGKVLHNCDPNMIVDMSTCTFYATRNIEPNEFLSMDYETTESHLFREFDCECGAYNCRKHISGKIKK
jgi:tyrocidine synthetase-3